MKTLKVLIVEDEIPAQAILKNALLRQFDDIEIVGVQSSVKGTVQWLRENPGRADAIFMDVELSDGMCFDIFDQTDVEAKIIITTAYDSYAVKAFKVNSIDYLLKPIDPEELTQAVARCRSQLAAPALDLEALRGALGQMHTAAEYKRRFVIRLGDRITVVDTDDIAYLYSEDKSTFLVTREGRRHILDHSLDAVQELLDPRRFFRASRNCIVEIGSIDGIAKHLSNRLKLTIAPRPEFEVYVSRSRIADFMDWLEGK